MAVTKLTLLRLINALKSVVALAAVPQLVLAHNIKDAEDGEQRNADLGHQVDGVSDRVGGCVGRHVGPSTKC